MVAVQPHNRNVQPGVSIYEATAESYSARDVIHRQNVSRNFAKRNQNGGVLGSIRQCASHL